MSEFLIFCCAKWGDSPVIKNDSPFHHNIADVDIGWTYQWSGWLSTKNSNAYQIQITGI